MEINLDKEIEFYFEELLEHGSLPDQTLKTIYATGFKDCFRMICKRCIENEDEE